MTPESLWSSDALGARLLRGVLTPLSAIFVGITTLRNWLYDAHILRTFPSPVPVISVGNLSVGGTGKTPVAAYLVRRLRALGLHPAIVMRGYGKDETEVHALLNPDTPVYADPDRASGIALAVRHGADTIVLDDAFQHRRAGRDLDFVLISAEQWRNRQRVLPAGPLREPLRALRRANIIGVTYRVTHPDLVRQAAATISATVPGTPLVSLYLHMGSLHAVAGSASIDLNQLSGSRVLAIAGIADARSFFGQLEGTGAIVDQRRFADHYPYTPADIASILADFDGHKYIITTLKDAVKLRLLWPAKAPPLWYVSQAVEVTDGLSAIDSALSTLRSKVRLDHPPAEI